MRSTIAYSKLTKRNLVLINNATYQRETLSEQPIRQPLRLLSESLRLNGSVMFCAIFNLVIRVRLP